MVALVFRTTGAWGAGQGFNLSNVQVDTNFYNLNLAVEALVANPAECISIESFEVIGNSLYIHLTDYSVQGPFELPVADFNPRGVWQPSTIYAVNDLVSMAGTLYIVAFAHTSALTFDPGANDGSGHDYYEVFFEAPETSLPIGGNTRDVLGKNSPSDFDVGWITGLVPNGGLADQVLSKTTSGDQQLYWRTPLGFTGLPIKTVTVNNYTFVVGDEQFFTRFTVTGVAVQLFIPTNAAQPFPIGAELTFRVSTASTVFISTSGLTISAPAGFQVQPFGAGAVMTFKKTGTNTWDVFGLLLPI